MLKPILIYFICSFNLLAQSKPTHFYEANSALPLEFRYLIDSIENTTMTTDQRVSFLSDITQLDHSFTFLSQEEIFFILKSEIYKSILKKMQGVTPIENWYSESITKKLEEKARLFYNSNLPFEEWLSMAIATDLKNTYRNSLTPTFQLAAKNGQKISDPEILRIRNRFFMLWSWASYLDSKDPNEIGLELMPLKLEILSSTRRYLRFYLIETHFGVGPAPRGYNLFYFVPRKEKVKKNESSTLDAVIDSITEKMNSKEEEPKGWVPEQKMAPSPTSDWRPEPDEIIENVYANPNYKAPKRLPRPLNDWKRELIDELVAPAPTPSPEYKKPNLLPKPQNDWKD